MRINYIATALGIILMYISLVILVPIIVALIDGDFSSIIPFFTASVISASSGFAIKKLLQGEEIPENLNDIKKAEA